MSTTVKVSELYTLKLSSWAKDMAARFNAAVYLVGSCLTSETPRDVDLRIVMPYNDYWTRFGHTDDGSKSQAYINEVAKITSHAMDALRGGAGDYCRCVDVQIENDVSVVQHAEKPRILLARPYHEALGEGWVLDGSAPTDVTWDLATNTTSVNDRMPERVQCLIRTYANVLRHTYQDEASAAGLESALSSPPAPSEEPSTSRPQTLGEEVPAFVDQAVIRAKAVISGRTYHDDSSLDFFDAIDWFADDRARLVEALEQKEQEIEHVASEWRTAHAKLGEEAIALSVERNELQSTVSRQQEELEPLRILYSRVCDWNNYGPPHQLDETDPGSIVAPDGEWEPMTKAMLDAVDACDERTEYVAIPGNDQSPSSRA